MSAAAPTAPGNAVALPLAALASFGIHALMLGAIVWATRPHPDPPQAVPQSELTVEAYRVERSEAAEAAPEAEAAPADSAAGEAVGSGAIPVSRATPAAPAPEAVEAGSPEGDAVRAAAPDAEGLRETPPPAEAAPAAAPAPERAAAGTPPALPVAAAEAPAEPAAAAEAPAEPVAAAVPPAQAVAAEPPAADPLGSVAPPAEDLAAAAAPAGKAAPVAPPAEAVPAATLPDQTVAAAAVPPVETVVGAPAPAELLPAGQPAGTPLPAAQPEAPAVAPAEAAVAVAPRAEAPRIAVPEYDAPAEAAPPAEAQTETAAAAAPQPEPAAEAEPPAEKGRATLAPVGPDGELDAKSLEAIEAFMQPGDAAAGAQEVRDGIEGLLASVPCARLQVEYDPDTGSLVLRGHIPDEALRGPLLAALAERIGQGIPVEADLRILPRPQCGSLSGIADIGLPQSNDQSSNPRILGDDAFALEQDYRAGQPLSLDLQGADYDAWVYADYFDASGNVIHLIPNTEIPLALVPAGSVYDALKARGGRGPLGFAFGPPYGQEIAVAFAASVPLYDGLRPLTEPAGPYLAFLKERVAAARAADPGFKGEWVYFFISSHP